MHDLKPSTIYIASILGRFYPGTSSFPVEGMELISDSRQG